MSGIGTGYDLSATTYSPDGKVFQTDYAQKAVDNSSTAIGLRCKDGVVLAVEKPVLSKLLVEGSGRRTFFLDHHAGAAVAGLLPDGRVVAARACDEAASYKAFYGEPIPGETLCERLGSYAHLFNLYWSMRPFGACLLLATYDEGPGAEPQLAVVEPSGVALRYHGAAVGKGRQAAKNEIEKLKLAEMGSREAVMQAARIIYKVREDADSGKPFEVEMAWISDDPESAGGPRRFGRVPKALQDEAERAAKAALEAEEMED